MKTILLGLLSALSLLPGCAELDLRRAMQDVQKKHIALSTTLDRGLEKPKNFEARKRSRELERALESPAIAEYAGVRNQALYQELLRDALAAVKQVRVEALNFDADETWQTRERISDSCQRCHDHFRARPVARVP